MTHPEVVQRWFDNLWNQGIESTIDELLARDAVVHGLGEDEIIGPDGFREFYHAFRSSFPSVHVTLHHILESGEHVSCRADVDVVSADGRGPFRFQGMCLIRLHEGMITEGWNYFDFLGLLMAMGAIPADTMTRALASAAVAR